MTQVRDDEEVTVYNYVTFDDRQKGRVQSPFKAPRERIVAAFGGQVLEGTAQLVPASELDDQGRYRRIATGWGDLH